MVASGLEAKVRHRDDIAIIDLVGDIDALAEEELTNAYAAAGDSPTTVVLNFEAVGYINSTGIALIVGLMASARKQGRTMIACGLSDHYREIFEITRLADFMPVVTDEAAAFSRAKDSS
jgi:anti-sigma B factor antagonist